MAEKKKIGTRLMIAVILAAAISPFTGIAQALIASKIWSYTLAAQYGDGPSIRSWFGMMLLTSFLFVGLAKAESEEDGKTDSIIMNVMTHYIMFVALQTFVLFEVMLGCLVWGWS